jgi:2-methylisocitrate lyase-like PEP mutase family enzyme
LAPVGRPGRCRSVHADGARRRHAPRQPRPDDTIARLQAFERAGADVLFAPGLRTREEIRTVCDAVSRPLNVLALPGMSLDDIVGAGAQRVSLGGGLAWVAVKAFADAAQAIHDRGDLSVLGARVPLRDWLA